MRCPLCDAENDASAEACFTCGRAFDALTQGFVLSGRYEVRRPVGSGGMGRVYEAFDRVLEEPVAIKVLRGELTGDPDMARRFRHEIKLARRISHPRVCRIHEYGQAGGLAYISMEYIAGRSLKAYLAARRPTLAEGFDLSLEIAEGLAAIHQHGVVHRDLKSTNIMVDGRGAVKILDFGIAKQVDGGTAGLTAGDRVFGTPEYMSPEQVEGGVADARSDIYALGCVVFEVFTGRPPFQAETPYATLLKHLKDPPPLDPAELGLPEGLLGVLSRALAKDRNERFRSAADLMAALRAARGTTSTIDSPTGPMRSSPASHATPGHSDTVTIFGRRLPRRQRWRWTVGAAAAVGLVFAVEFTRIGRSTPTATTVAQEQGLRSAPALESSTPPRGAALTPPPATAQPPASAQAVRPAMAGARRGPPSTVPSLSTATDEAPSASTANDPPQAPPPTMPAERAASVVAPLATLPAPAGGTLALRVVPDAEVLLDGTSIGVVGQRDIPLSGGQHRLEVRHPDYQPLPRFFVIRADQTTPMLLDLQEKGIRIVSKPRK
jgi:serine/threonine protein kinase